MCCEKVIKITLRNASSLPSVGEDVLECLVYLVRARLLGHPPGHAALLQTHQHVLLIGKHRHPHHGHAVVQCLQNSVHATVSEEQHRLGVACLGQDTREGEVVLFTFWQYLASGGALLCRCL